ncbi:hypothetical protein Fcan01_16308 [Folsomia candida]|uniref:Uncharacterized protein n=1 Tax=Folsomia candida TaxID=158441 RepID=A0A226DVX6_FOLCA|nr:hypothetical protein Fcan01_16308 [Folsomia candida]
MRYKHQYDKELVGGRTPGLHKPWVVATSCLLQWMRIGFYNLRKRFSGFGVPSGMAWAARNILRNPGLQDRLRDILDIKDLHHKMYQPPSPQPVFATIVTIIFAPPLLKHEVQDHTFSS